jgi:hypothetical protein
VKRACALLLLSLAAIAVSVAPSRAACGSDMCSIDLRGPEASTRRWSLDLAYQFIDQDHVRIGTEPAEVGAIPSHHNEVSTVTKAWSATGRAIVSPRLAFGVTVPWMKRTHVHEHEHHGELMAMEWDFDGLGDALLSAYWTPGGTILPAPYSISVQAGVKLPTGRRNVPEVDGDQPEPMARPSTGSYDQLVGLQVRRPVTTRTLKGVGVPVTYALGVTRRFNGVGTDDYAMGDEWAMNLSGGWALSPAVTFLGQVNSRIRGRDTAGLTDTDPAMTGGTAVYATPGLRVGLGGVGLYTYYQARVYEKVNGIQITAPSHLMFGMSYSL